ncbi:AB hydrolase-1 domain-containing protein [Fusarium falciforme]|uniref:AB hydrolase-1 domain-containing protein n=1 Tax=Fusarium falciforme TaxID=195108 RepID=UPI002218EBA5|nr:AB hydrolase-1 domain-containing protein [Fusarium falciforme]KAI8649778.1 AB hydrolase-1 domain-containing protein [Fusarium keratoplasticum]WAO97406.1 AB hydrolase-1 domain-containing protein [Fusarium falciforme]
MAFTSTTEIIELQADVKLHVIWSFPRPEKATPSATVIFLHFWGGSSATWSPVNSLIAETFPTVRIDFRGWGNSTGPEDETAYSTIQLAEDVEGVLQHLNLPRYILVGHSMGAKIAQAVAGRKVHDGLAGLILVCPAPPTPLVLPDEMRDQQINAYNNAENAEFVTRNVLTSKTLSDELVQSAVKTMLKGNKYAKAAWPRYAMRDDIVSLAEGIEVPTLVIAGEKDAIESVSRVKAEVVANISDAKSVVVEEVGHLALLEAPERIAVILNGFMSDII